MIEAFGQFVVGGNYIVGFVLFLALIAIQFLVISHGAVRTAEVTARFTLDAMPGKQMAIDADLNAGIINEQQAKARRERVAREAEFCGAMDGAARFSQRDSLATILIMAINIIAGFLIGVFQQGVPFQEALKTYTILTVGDGLVTILPSLLVSVAGGIVVTRAASKESLGVNVGKQLFNSPRLLWIAGGALTALGLIPGLPKFSFFSLAAVLMYAAWKMKPQVIKDEVDELELLAKTALPGGPASPAAGSHGCNSQARRTHARSRNGPGAAGRCQAGRSTPGPGKVDAQEPRPAARFPGSLHPHHRQPFAEGAGICDLPARESRSRAGSCAATACWPSAPMRMLADLPGQDTREPAFDVAAKWISPQTQGQAIAAGYAVVDPTSVLAAHLAEVIRQNAHELLSRHETRRLIDRLSESHPKLADELIPKLMSLGEVQKVLQQLLREQVSIRDLGTILETLVDAASFNKNPIALVEAVRHTLGRALIRPLLNDKGELKVVTLDSAIEEECMRGSNLQPNQATSTPQQLTLARRVLDGLRTNFGKEISMAPPVLLCSSPGRYYLRRLLEPFIPKIVVISPGEIPPLTPVQSIGVLH